MSRPRVVGLPRWMQKRIVQAVAIVQGLQPENRKHLLQPYSYVSH